MTTGSRSPTVLVIGEALVDIVDGQAHPGGSPANVAVALGRLGVDVTLATRLGMDPHGELIRAHLAESGVTVLSAVADKTSSALGSVDPSGVAHYDFDLEQGRGLPALPEADLVHVGSFSALTFDLPLDRFATYDINVRPTLMPPDPVEIVERLVAASRIVKASDEDLRWLYPKVDVTISARALQRLGPEVVWLTRGGEGATAYTDDGSFEQAVVPVQVCDTIGAGDTFTAGLLLGLLRFGPDWARAGKLAAWMAAQTASRVGADPPWSLPQADPMAPRLP